uniref:Hyphothetical protein n=1 Tax=Staphylococcus aureus TaxID=1280 RepID=Q93IA4_STAAU|nr:hyphothetical protein [Staphylococcus aureus]BAC53816.1 hyphothetical protein [Staphylococcus aureus]
MTKIFSESIVWTFIKSTFFSMLDMTLFIFIASIINIINKFSCSLINSDSSFHRITFCILRSKFDSVHIIISSSSIYTIVISCSYRWKLIFYFLNSFIFCY